MKKSPRRRAPSKSSRKKIKFQAAPPKSKRTPSVVREYDGKMNRFLLWLAGKNPATLRYMPQGTRTKFKVAGSLILIPALMAIVSGNFAAAYLTDNWLIGFIGTLAFAAIVLFLDRAIYIYTKPRQFNPAVVLRMLLIFAMAFALSFPFELRLFEGAINNEITAQAIEQNREVQDRYHGLDLNLIQRQEAQQKIVAELNLEYNRELTGRNGKRGDGPIAGKIKEQLDKERKNLENLQKEVEDARKKNLAYHQKEESLTNQSQDDLSVRIGILEILTHKNKGILFGVWLLRLILILIDITPLAMKWAARDEDLEVAERKAQHERDTSYKVLDAIRPLQLRVAHLQAQLFEERHHSAILYDHLKQDVAAKERFMRFSLKQLYEVRMKQYSLREPSFASGIRKSDKEQLVQDMSRIYEIFITQLEALVEQYSDPEMSPQMAGSKS